MYLSLYCKGSKRVTQGLSVRGSWRPNRTAIFWPPLLWPSALCLSRSPGLLNRRPRGPLCWLSLPHLISNCSGPQLIRGPKDRLGSLALVRQLVKEKETWHNGYRCLAEKSFLVKSPGGCRFNPNKRFANGPGDQGSVPGRIIPKILKMVLDTSLLNTQKYKVRIKGKVEQSRERISTLPYISV